MAKSGAEHVARVGGICMRLTPTSWNLFLGSRSNQRWMKIRTTVQLSSAIISSTIKTSKPTLQMEDSFIKRFPTRQVAEKQCANSAFRIFHRSRSNQRWTKLRTTVQLSSAISSTIETSKPTLQMEDSFIKRFSTRQVAEMQETLDIGDDGECSSGSQDNIEYVHRKCRLRRKQNKLPWSVVNPDENLYFIWLMVLTGCTLYNLWTAIVRQSLPELQRMASSWWLAMDTFSDIVFLLDVAVQFRTGYLEHGLMVYNTSKLAGHYIRSRSFLFDLIALTPLSLIQLKIGVHPILRFPRVESRTVYPNFWRVINLIHHLLLLAHWFGCFYYLLSEAEEFKGNWVIPYKPGDNATFTSKYLGLLYWSTLTLTTIGDLPTPETNAEYVFTIVSYLIGVFIFATIVGQVGNVITNRNANRLEFKRLMDGAKLYMRHHKVPNGMKKRVLRWYDYSWSRGRIQGGGDINTVLGLLPDKLKTELALHVYLVVLKKVTLFKECQPELLHDLVLKMKTYIFTPGDLICRKGEVAREMFIIADGILEVISNETGHVLAILKAGDFFGEIGILNLDGFNKRTADVRSVGYSELFSLSREDVLAAMKNYPEAQDILQTLGRKRLMEARNANKIVADSINSRAEAAENCTGISGNAEKIRRDVKGLQNAFSKGHLSTSKTSQSKNPDPIPIDLSHKTDLLESSQKTSTHTTVFKRMSTNTTVQYVSSQSDILQNCDDEILNGNDIVGKYRSKIDELESEINKRDYTISTLCEQLKRRNDSVNTVMYPKVSSFNSLSPFSVNDPRCYKWEYLSEEENLELRDCPKSIIPEPPWQHDETRIDMNCTIDEEDTQMGELGSGNVSVAHSSQQSPR
ncbi:hypothetical protein ACI65C_001363 [Semiaphis heraclei]